MCRHLLTAVVAVTLTLATCGVSRPAPARPPAARPAAENLTLSGTVYGWAGTRSVPLSDVTVYVIRNRVVIGRAQTDKDGKFLVRDIPPGPPVLVVFDKSGYGEGKLLCGRADEAPPELTITLLLNEDVRKFWADDTKGGGLGGLFSPINTKMLKEP
jgi:hypothetical protein